MVQTLLGKVNSTKIKKVETTINPVIESLNEETEIILSSWSVCCSSFQSLAAANWKEERPRDLCALGTFNRTWLAERVLYVENEGCSGVSPRFSSNCIVQWIFRFFTWRNTTASKWFFTCSCGWISTYCPSTTRSVSCFSFSLSVSLPLCLCSHPLDLVLVSMSFGSIFGWC
jgi:hypothetical protein